MKLRFWFSVVLALIFGCDGQAIFLPQDNTRMDWLELESPFGDPIKVQFLLNEEQHNMVLANAGGIDWALFNIENRRSDGSWVRIMTDPFNLYYGGEVEISPEPGTSEVSYRWHFYIDDAYNDLQPYTEAGTWGDTYELRVEIYTADGWVPIPGIQVHYTKCLEMQLAGEQCPLVETVRIRLVDSYVPDITQGDVTCQYGDDACSPCIENLVDKIKRPGLHIGQSEHRQQLVMGSLGTAGSVIKDHIQGYARLADVVHGDGTRTARGFLSDNTTPQGIHYFEATVTSDEDTVHIPNLHMDKVFDLTIRSTPFSPIFPNIWDHPGGMSAHGNTALLAMDEGGYGQIYLMHAPPGADADDIELYSRPISYWASIDGASAAAFVKLASGNFLLVVAGTDHGREDVWFFESSDTILNPENQWYPVGHWDPCKTLEGDLPNCFGGAAGMNLLTDCNGDIYMFTFNGTNGDAFNPEYQFVQTYRIEQNPQTGAVEPKLVYYQLDNQGLVVIDNPSFRWSGTAYVTEDRRVAYMNTERRTNDCQDHHKVCSDVYISDP